MIENKEHLVMGQHLEKQTLTCFKDDKYVIHNCVFKLM